MTTREKRKNVDDDLSFLIEIAENDDLSTTTEFDDDDDLSILIEIVENDDLSMLTKIDEKMFEKNFSTTKDFFNIIDLRSF